MDSSLFSSTGLYAWFILPLLIFVARIADVSIRNYPRDIYLKGFKVPGAGCRFLRNTYLAFGHRSDYEEPFKSSLLYRVCRRLRNG